MADNQDRVMLTTTDNPWNPFTHYDEWWLYDQNAGYYSTALLARVALSSDELSELDQQIAYEDAIDEVVRENISGVHRKVYRDEVKVGNG